MNVLLDTCALLWWINEPRRLSSQARSLFEDERINLHWSAASTWELALRAARKGLELPGPLHEFLPRVLGEENVLSIPITDAHALRVSELPWHHKDPFDRLLVAQAQVERMPLVTSDKALREYDVAILW